MLEKNKNDKRMLEVMKSLENKKEVFKESTREVDEKEILAEQKRMREILTGEKNLDFQNENYYIAGSFNTGGQGKTVNSFIDSQQNSSFAKAPKTQPSDLKPEEALEVCVKRTIKSGKPINNISFYDEVNHNLMNLGFPAVDSIKIKEYLIELISE